jgi:hypothetical protein
MGKKIYRIISWILLIQTILSILLVLRKPSAPQVATSPEAAKSFDAKLQDLVTAHQQGTPKEVRISETELNSKLQESMQGAPAPPSGPAKLEAATVHLDGDKLAGIFTVNISGKDIYVTLGGKLGVMNHTIQFTPTEVGLGSMPVPVAFVGPALRDKLNSPEFRNQMQLPESIKDVRIENGELVIQSQ